jgi:hypothetical protein
MSVISFSSVLVAGRVLLKATNDFRLSQLSNPSGHLFWPSVSGGLTSSIS